jgi:Protein of unknown function (DUF3349)
MVDDTFRELVEQLRHAYPRGVPEDGYMALLTVLRDDMSERNLAIVVAKLIGGEVAVVANDAAAAQSVRKPSPAAGARVKSALESAGWHPESSSPSSP